MTLLWSANPLGGVVVWGSAGIVAWSLIATLVGSILGIFCEIGAGPAGTPLVPAPPRDRQQRPLRPRVAAAAA